MRIVTAYMLTVLVTALPVNVRAQAVQPGSIVEVNAYGSWDTIGKILQINEYGILVLYRGQDGSYDEHVGFTRYFDPKDVRPYVEPGTPGSAPAGGPPAPNTLPRAGPPAGGGAGLMSQGEILGYLQERIGDNPWTHPQKPQVIEALAAEVRRRGVDFIYETMSDFASELTNSGGNETTIPNAIGYNYGPPTEPEWYPGTWDMVIIGAPVDVVRGDRVYTQGEIGARGGSIQVAGDGTYVWKLYASDPTSAHVRGRWRAATEAEMRYQGGAGIVLQGGKSGEDWLMREDRTTDAGPNDMVVSLVEYWAQREFGTRR